MCTAAPVTPSDLGIEHDASIDKEELRELVLQKDALTKWEKKHPGQKKVSGRMCTACALHVLCALHHTAGQVVLHRRRPARHVPPRVALAPAVPVGWARCSSR